MNDLSRGPGSFPRTAEHREFARKASMVRYRSEYIALLMEYGESAAGAARRADDMMERAPDRILPDPEPPSPPEDP